MRNYCARVMLALSLLLPIFAFNQAHALSIANRALETTTSTGTGAVNLGGALNGFQTLIAAVGNGATVPYKIYDPATGAWEFGTGVVASGSPPTLTRTTCTSNSSGTQPSKISFAAGGKFVSIEWHAEVVTQGTVTSAALSLPAEFSVGGSPITASGTFTVSWANQSANKIWAGPVSGGAAAPTFRDMVTADIGSGLVTYAKIQNISATQRVLGRNTAGSGVTEEVTASQFLDWIGSTQGQILYRNGSTWTILATGTAGQYLTTQGAAANPSWTTPTAGTYNDPLALQNVGLSVTVGSNATTIALKQLDGSTDPGAGSASCNIGFASATATSGAVTMRSVTGALSLTVPDAQVLGFGAAETHRIWIGAIDNAGTVELCVWNSISSNKNLLRIYDGQLVTTTAIATAPSAQVVYSTTARTAKPIRVLGYYEITLGASSHWSNSPSVVRVAHVGMPRTGDVIQTQRNDATGVATGTTVMPNDDTPPQITEGNEYMTQAITPTSALNILKITAHGMYANNTNAFYFTQALFQDATNDALSASFTTTGGAAYSTTVTTNHRMIAATTSSTTFRIRAGQQTGGGGTNTFNGVGGNRYFNGKANSFLEVSELFQ